MLGTGGGRRACEGSTPTRDTGLACSVCGPGLSPPQWPSGSTRMRAQHTCQIPISSKNSPDGHSTGHVYGMDGRLQKMFI